MMLLIKGNGLELNYPLERSFFISDFEMKHFRRVLLIVDFRKLFTPQRTRLLHKKYFISGENKKSGVPFLYHD